MTQIVIATLFVAHTGFLCYADEMSTLAPAVCRAARGLLDWSQRQLAVAARVGESTIRNFESGRSVPVMHNLAAIRATLEAAGVEFIDENGGGPGVRLLARGEQAPK